MEPSPESRPGAAALLDLYEEGLRAVYGYLLYRCRSSVVAEELTSETFLAAAAAVVARPEAEVGVAWLIGVARHKLIDHWRTRSPEERLLDTMAVVTDDLEDPWDATLDALRAEQTLAALPSLHRAVLTLRYVDDLPVREVARHLDRTEQGAEALLVRARRSFRHAYQREEGHDG